MNSAVKTLAVMRISLGLIFLWAFFDKLFGLGFATPADRSWLDGFSPTIGYLKNASYGPLSSFYGSIAGHPITDWLFMLGLLFVGAATLLGVAIRLATMGGIFMMILIWSTTLPPKNHPFIDEHVVYALGFLAIYQARATDIWGLGQQWRNLGIVKRFPILG